MSTRRKQGLHEAAWPDMLTNLQAAYSQLTRAQFDLKRHVTETEEARELFHLLVESMSEALLLTDRSGRITRTNRAAMELLERTEEELVGKTLAEATGTHELPASPWQLLERADSGQLHDADLELLSASGRAVPVSASCVLVRDASTKIIGMLVVARDTTERRRAERERMRLLASEQEARQEAETLYRIARVLAAELELPQLAQAVTDSAAEVTGARYASFEGPALGADDGSGERYLTEGTRPSLFEGLPPAQGATAGVEISRDAIWRIDDLAPESPESPEGEAIRSYLAVPVVSRSAELMGILRFGHPEPGRFTERAVRLATGIASQAAVALDNARLYRRAQEAIHARDEFLSIASHELRNPVTAITGTLQLLRRMRERRGDDARADERFLANIDGASRRLAVLTEDLLDVARLQSGRFPLRPEPFNLADLVRAAVDHVEPPQRVRVEIACDPCAVFADPVRIEQVLTNLLDNAVKYSPGGGPIDLALREEAEGVLIQVRDRGVGLPEDVLPTIFEPFGRAGSANESNTPGLGLGLYICRSIAEQHGGRIWAESQGEGRGATFSLWLPSHGR